MPGRLQSADAVKRFLSALIIIALCALPASARLQVNQLIGFGVTQPSAAAVTLAFQDSGYDGSCTSTTKTWSAVDFGAAVAGRVIIVATGAWDVNTGATGDHITSATIGGVSATINVQLGNSGNAQDTGIFSAVVPTGTSGDVVITYGDAPAFCTFAAYRATGLSGATANDTQSNDADPVNFTLTVPSGGISVSSAIVSSGDTTAISWTNQTEDFAQDMEAADIFSAASNSTDTGSVAVTGDADGTPAGMSGVGASWGP